MPLMQPIFSQMMSAAIPAAQSGGQQSCAASGPIGGNRVLAAASSSACGYADNTNPSNFGRVIGLSTSAAPDGAQVSYKSTGEMTNSGWTFPPGADLFAGINGMLTEIPPSKPAAVFSQRVAIAVTSNTISIRLAEPIIL
jgi:hypothetical protein